MLTAKLWARLAEFEERLDGSGSMGETGLPELKAEKLLMIS